MNNPTFAERFCAQNQIPLEHYARAVFDRALYPRAKLVKWLLPVLRRGYFAADFDLIYGVERLRRMRDFAQDAERFHEHPINRGWLRRKLGLRVSTHRLRALVKETLPRPAESAAPERPVRGRTVVPFNLSEAA